MGGAKFLFFFFFFFCEEWDEKRKKEGILMPRLDSLILGCFFLQRTLRTPTLEWVMSTAGMLSDGYLCLIMPKEGKKKKEPFILLIAASFAGAQGNR